MAFGMKASQLGYDVNTAADYQLLYSSEWPLLKIEAQGTVTITDMGSDQVLYTHNLGYCPLFWIYEVVGGNSYPVGNTTPRITTAQFGVNSTELKYFNNFASSGAYTIRYVIFRLDLESTFTAQTINLSPGSQTVIDGYGIKIAGPGKDIDSTDYRDFTVHSSTRSPMVHSVQAKTLSTSDPTNPFYGAGAYSETWTHDLGYKPMYFIFIKLTTFGMGLGYYCGMQGDGSGNQFLDFIGTTLRVSSAFSGDIVSVVILKDQSLL